jgi:hypothetical protein
MTYMKTYHILTVTFLIAIITSSCKKDWLGVKSDAKLVVPSTLQDFQALLDDTQYMTIAECDKGEIASDGHYISDVNFINADEDEYKDAYVWTKTVRHETLNNLWETFYKKILYCNIVLEGISKYKSKSNNLRGQALFQRAFEFFQLSQLYTPPFKGNENSDLGLIMRLNTDITIPSIRSTIKTTYDQIITDFVEAASLLPSRPLILTRGSRTSAFAMLARVNLYIGNYEDSQKYADECLTLYSKLLDYNIIPINNKFIGIYNDEVLFHANFSTTAYTSTQCLMNNNLVDSYDLNDLRKKVYFFKNTNNTYTFIGNYYKAVSPLFCGLATDEVFLTRAECYARTGKINEAMADLNALLKTRWNKSVTYPTMAANDAEDALNKILEERRKSLILRGTRWMDLRRLNSDPRFAIILTRTISGTTYTLEPNSYKYAFPIPDDIVEQIGVKQNPGW